MQRRLMKALEDVSVQYDYTVRESNQTVVQFCYGVDGYIAAGFRVAFC